MVGEAQDGARRRMFELDLVRFIAACSVVVYHYARLARGLPTSIQRVTGYGFLGVELFFFISGFVIFESVGHRSPGRFAVSRVGRLFPAYWVAVVVAAAVGFLRHDHLGPLVMLANLSMLEQFAHLEALDGVFWTLTVELAFYGLVWLTLALGQLDRAPILLAAWLVGSTVIEVVRPIELAREWLITQWCPFFVVGAALAMIRRRRDDRVAWALWAAGLGVCLWQSALQTDIVERIHPAHLDRWVGAAIVGACALLVTALATGRLESFGRAWMTPLGALTYPLYLIHHSVGLALFERLDGLSPVLSLSLVIALALAGAWLINRLVEVPLAPRLRRLLHRAIDRSGPGADALPTTAR